MDDEVILGCLDGRMILTAKLGNCLRDRPEEPGDFQTEPIFTSELEPWRPTSTVGATTEGQHTCPIRR
jgi:hypothetical protein